MWKILPYHHSTIFSSGALRRKQPDWLSEDRAAVFDPLPQGRIKPVIAQRVGLVEAVDARARRAGGGEGQDSADGERARVTLLVRLE